MPSQPDTARSRRHLAVLLTIWLCSCVAWLLPGLGGPHRGWEAVLVSGVVDERAEIAARQAPFVPMARWEGTATGDLAFAFGMPGAATPRHQVFTTDEAGFRNPPGTCAANREVVVVGNSFAVGSGVSDDQNVTGQLRELGIAATNCGGLDLQTFTRDPRFADAPPKWLVHYVDEANLRPIVLQHGQPPLELPEFDSRATYEDWIRERVAAHDEPDDEPGRPSWLMDNAAQRRLKRWLDDRDTLLGTVFEPLVPHACHRLGLLGFHAAELMHYDRDSGQLFFERTGARYLSPPPAPHTIGLLAATFLRIDKQLQERGTRLIVLVCPNKEAVYHDLIPALRERDPGVLLRTLSESLTKAGVANVDASTLCATARRQHPGQPLFLPDDTHPSPFLQELLARELARIVRGG